MATKTIFFDAGPIITLVMARLAWILPPLKKQFGGEFYITPAVKYELIDRPLTVKRFQFEALEVSKMVREGLIKIYPSVNDSEVSKIKKLVNGSFSMRGRNMDVLQEGEVQSITAAKNINSSIVMDERTLRLLIENNKRMKSLLERRFHGKVVANLDRINKFSNEFKQVNIIRSVELIGIAFKMGLLDDYILKRRNGTDILLNAVLYAARYNGCAVTDHEIEELKDFLSERIK